MAQTIVESALAGLGLAGARSWRRGPLGARALLVLALAGTVLVTGVGLAVGGGLAKPQPVQLVLVQNSSGVVVDRDKGTLTLKGVSPTTVFFSDRPARVAGHFMMKEFLRLWDEAKDGFLADGLSATLSVFERGQTDLVDVVVRLRNPRLRGSDLVYDITVLDGEPPKAGGPASLFIEVSGPPWTPLSYWGGAEKT